MIKTHWPGLTSSVLTLIPYDSLNHEALFLLSMHGVIVIQTTMSHTKHVNFVLYGLFAHILPTMHSAKVVFGSQLLPSLPPTGNKIYVPNLTALHPENVRVWRLTLDGGVNQELQMANNHRIEQFHYIHPPLKTAKVRATIVSIYSPVVAGGMEHIWFYRAVPHNNYWGFSLL